MRIVENVVKQVLKEYINQPMMLKTSVIVSDGLKYHLLKKIPLSENKFKINSKSFINLINEVRRLYNKGLIGLNKNDRNIVESDLARKVLLENGQVVYLEIPIEDQNFLSEAEYQGRKVQLGKIMQGDVKNPKCMLKTTKEKLLK